MKFVLNPKYEKLKGFKEKLLSHSYNADKVYRNFRNIVEDVSVDGFRLIIKKFKKPTEVNRVVYTLFRQTKAERAYNYSIKLKQEGIDVPEPVAFVEVKKGLFFHTGYFISEYTDYRSIADFRDNKESPEEMSLFYDSFAAFAADFHSKGFIHNDFNIDNILYKKIDGHYHFQIIDLNRMQFNKHSKLKCAKDMSSLHFYPQAMSEILSRYCKIRGFDCKEFTKVVNYKAGKAKSESKLKDIILIPLGLRKRKRNW